MTVKNDDTDRLCAAVLSLETPEQCYNFFEDVCTIKELQALSQRLEVARLLREKKTFSEIVAETGASTATISRVNRCLMYGAGGYSYVLDRLEGK
ncbi:MAG: TrpR-like protein YerC/YecD [Clostridia bacterium]|nr:TrpR-like protein YerC/YecD [Clostridia bacterium]